MARRYKLNQEGAEVQDLLDKIDSLKINESTEQSSVVTELETLDIEGASYSVVSKKVNDLLNYYTKSETYSGAQIDSKLDDKADITNVYTKQDIDIALAGKANIVDVPTKTSDLSNDSGFIAGQQVAETYETKIDAASKQTALQAAINTKQDRINDLQTIREGAAAGATAYQKPDSGIPASDLASGVIPDVSQFITKSVNDLVNYYTKSETYTKDEVATLIGAIQHFHYEIAASISAVTDPSNNVLYLIGPTGTGADKYEEYVYTNNTWTKIGDTSIDLSGYVTTQALNTALSAYTTTNDLTTLLAGKQDTIDAQHKLDYSLIANTPTIPTVPTDIVKYTEQTLTDAQKSQARTNIGAGTYSKPANGIPASDLANGVIPTIPTEVFVVTYGTTTQSEILAAVAAGQLPVCKYGDNLYVYAGESSADYSQFTSVLYDTAYRIYVKNSTWGNGSYEIYSKPSGGIPASDLAAGVIPTVPTDIVKYTAQTLTDEQKTQARTNIGAGTYSKPSGGIPASDIANGVIPVAPVNADWNATSGLAEILNKPTYAGSPTAGGFANKAVAIPFGNVDATSTSTALTATVDNFPTTLVDGVCAYIRNDVVGSASGFTLNINGTGALPVYQTMADETRISTVFNATSTYLFIYNSSRVEGGCWDLYYGYNSNENTIGYNLRTNGASTPPAAQKYYRYRLLFTAANGQSLVPANTSTSTSTTAAKAVNQTAIDPFGVIFYYSSTSAVNAGTAASASYLWMQYNGIVLGYSFNRTGEALEMTARDPVYLKCAPQSDGSAIMDADTPIVQAIPSTADGNIYIFLGFAESATAITLYYWHPVYYIDANGRKRIWTGEDISVS